MAGVRIVLTETRATVDLDDGSALELLRDRDGDETLTAFATRVAALAEMSPKQRAGLLQRYAEAVKRQAAGDVRPGDDALIALRLAGQPAPTRQPVPADDDAQRIAAKLFDQD